MRLDDKTHDRLVKALAQHLGKLANTRAHVYRTHISSVIVCAQYAYKLKRPVKLPFVDFSTAALRRADCLRELSLNQRTAPALYLDVIEITGTLEQPELHGPGEVIEYAVRMKRFKQTDLLSHIVQTNRFDAAIAANLGKHHAEFIGQLPALSYEQASKHKPTHAWLLESLDEIRSAQPDLHTQIQAVTQWANQRNHILQPVIKQRQRQGHYRQVHGDLHLGNLVMLKHQVVAFDALEFNPALSQIDTINDIAFTFMDLLAHGRSDWAWAMINQWCETCGDYAGLVLLRYYTLYRAVVRAKVACLSSDDRLLARYWSLALRLIAPANTSKLILVCGLSGSGKSTVARELVKLLSGIQLRADVIRKHRFAKWLNQPQKLYAKTTTTQTYRALARLADQLLTQNMTVIVDATFLAQEHIDLFHQLAQHHHIQLERVSCEAPAAILRRRIMNRLQQASDPSDATVDVLQAQLEQLRQHPLRWPGKGYRADTSKTRADTLRRTKEIAQRMLKSSHLAHAQLKSTKLN